MGKTLRLTRDENIIKSYSREINMRESTVKSKKSYNRKLKHKNQGWY